ncbi:MAG TPA: ATP-binding cassette domain-containing protein [Bacteroidia bacterium]|nr:ATP-binding cassette domain-containing protein [Bacteroidia bacterium]
MVLEIEKLSLSFEENEVLKEFNLTLAEGENLAVIGKSGSGKSVLIKCIVGLIKPDSGKIAVFGKDILELERDALDELRVKIGFMFQSDALYDSMTIRENLQFPLRRRCKEMEEEEMDELVEETLDSVGLKKTIDMMPSELSGGMKKRIALARTLVLKPDIILYDEPTSGLDPITTKEISDLIVEVQGRYKSSSVIITHDLRSAKKAADRLLIIADGKNHATGTYEELAASDDKKVKEFFE